MWFQLKPQEAEFLAVNTNAALSTFEKVSENIGMCMYYLISIHLRWSDWYNTRNQQGSEKNLNSFLSFWASSFHFCLGPLLLLLVNPLSPDIHLQILQTDLHRFPWRICWDERIWYEIKAFSLRWPWSSKLQKLLAHRQTKSACLGVPDETFFKPCFDYEKV